MVLHESDVLAAEGGLIRSGSARAAERGMRVVDAGIQHGDLYALAFDTADVLQLFRRDVGTVSARSIR